MANIQITTITPVHVGSGRFLLRNTEYVFSSNKIGVIDEKKVLDHIGEEKIGSWVASIEKGEGLVTFLKGFGNVPTLQKISGRTITLNCDNTEAKSISSLKEHIHNGAGLPYLPGSSIKGAIRSAVFNQYIRKNKNNISSNEITPSGKVTASILEKSIFGRDPNHDVFRFLRVGDAYFEENSTDAIILENLNLKKDRGEETAVFDNSKWQLVEAIGSGKSTTFKLKFDIEGMDINRKNEEINNFPESFPDVGKLFALINHNTGELLKGEKEFWEEYPDDEASSYCEKLEEILIKVENCTNNQCIMRMAHGSGWSFITGAWAKNPDIVSVDLYPKIVDAARPKNREYYSQYPFPKSRRISSNIDLPGFVQLEIIS